MKASNKKVDLISYSMMAPWLLLFVLFTVLPILAAVFLSFTNFDMFRMPKVAGLSNYLRLFLEDDVFLIALRNTALFAVVTGPLGYLLSFVVAWFINDVPKAIQPFMTLLFYTPTLAGNVYFVWQFIFSGDSYGLVNSLLMRIGILGEPLQWLTDVDLSFAVCIIVILWMSMGTGFLTMMAGFKNLNVSLFEAGALDGIRSRWQEMWYITLPQMKPQLLIGAVLSISSAFAVGYQCMALTGFPSTDYSTHTLVLHILDYGTTRYEMGYACTIATVLFVLMVVTWNGIERAMRQLGDE